MAWGSVFGAALAGWAARGSLRAQPSLSVAALPDAGVRVSWPRGAGTFNLETTAQLGATAAWRRVDLPVVVVQDEASVVLVPGAATAFFRLREAGLTHIVIRSPEDAEQGVAVTRPTVVEFDRPLGADTLLTTGRFHAEAGGRRVLGRVELSNDRRTATLFPLEPLPGSSRVAVTFDSDGLVDHVGAPVDADRDGQPGGVAIWSFETLGTTPLPGTVVVGRVFAAELVPGSDTGTNAVNRALEGVTITVDGREEDLRAVTDATGAFRLEPAPPGRFFVHIDGRTAVGSDYPGGAFYPVVGKAWEAVAGRTNLAGGTGAIYLPLIAQHTLQPVSAVDDTTVTFPPAVVASNPALAGVSITVPANSLFADDGTRGGRVGIAPVPPDRLPGPLPPGLEFPLVITVQTDGPLNFDRPAPVCFPNLPDPVLGRPLPPGSRQALISFNHRKGEWEAVGGMTVSADGRMVCTDPGVGIRQPGWHGVGPDPKKPKCDPEKECCEKSPPPPPGLLAEAGLHDGQPLECGERCRRDPEKLAACFRRCRDAWDECETLGYLTYLKTLENCQLVERRAGKEQADDCRRRADETLDARLDDCLDEKLACEKECVGCFGTPRSSAAKLTGSAPGFPATEAGTVEAIRGMLESISGLLAPYRAPGVVIPQAVTDEISRQLTAAHAVAGGDAVAYLTDWMIANERARVAAGKYPPDYGNAPPYPVRYVAEVRRPTGSFFLRGETEPFGKYSVFVPRDGELVEVSFYDPRTKRWGSVTPYQRPEAADRLPWFNLDRLPADAPDADADGLPDVVEAVYGTNPAKPDSDNDGVPDGAEIERGADPLDGFAARTGIIATAQTAGPAVDLATAGERVLVAEQDRGISIFEVSRANRPIRMAQVDTPGVAARVAAADDYAAVADGAAGLAIIAVTDPATARVAHQITLGGDVTAVAAGGGRAFAGTAGGQVAAIDLARGAVLSMLVLGKRVEDLAVADDHVYALTADTLFVLVEEPIGLRTLGEAGSPFVASPNARLAVGDGRAYCTHGKGCNTFDVTDPAAPRLVAAANTAQFGWKQTVPDGSGFGLAAVSPILDLSSPADHNVALYDLHDPTRPDVFLTLFPTPGFARAVAIVNGMGLVADDRAGLEVINYLPYDDRGMPPTIALATNAATEGVEEAKPVRVTARVADDVQVRQVRFYVDGNLAFVDGSYPFEYRFTSPLRTAEKNRFTVRAVAEDTGGNVATSEDLALPLLEDTTPPRVVRALPAVGGAAVTQVFAFASEPLDPSSVTPDSFVAWAAGADGALGTPDDVAVGNGVATWVPELSAAVLSWAAPLAEGRYRARLTAQIRDATGHAMTEPFEWEFSVNTVAWVGGASGSWHDPRQWSTGAVPGDGDSVVIDVPGDVTVTFSQGTIDLRRLVCGNVLEIAGGTFTVQETVDVARPLRLSGGTFRAATVRGGPEAYVLVPPGGRPTLEGVTLDLAARLSDSAQAAVRNGLTLNGALTFTRSFGRPMTLDFAGDQVLAGSGEVVFDDGDGWAQLRPIAGTLTIGSGVTIRGGHGTVGDPSFTLVNRGTIRAEGTQRRLTVRAASLQNEGTLSAGAGASLTVENVLNSGTVRVANDGAVRLEGQWRNTGTLALDGGTLTLGGTFTLAQLGRVQRQGGDLVLAGTLENAGATFDLAASGGSWRLGGGRIQGGTVTGASGAPLVLGPGARGTLEGVALEADVRIEDSAILTVTGGLTLNGTLTLTRSFGRYLAVEFAGAQTLAGTGEVVFDDGDGWAQVRPVSGDLTIGSGVTIRGGTGTIGEAGLPLVNEGTIAADVSGRTLTIRANPFVNHGSVVEANGGRVIVPARVRR